MIYFKLLIPIVDLSERLSHSLHYRAIFSVRVSLRLYVIVGLFSILGTITFSTTLSAHDTQRRSGLAAGGGFQCRSDGRKRLKIRTNCQASHAPACAKPPVRRRHFFNLYRPFHHYFLLKNSLFAFAHLKKFQAIFYVQYVLSPLP